ncbi:MAG: flagellar hook-basal body complex protein FliE [Heliobacteriaceae bacterium]|nr:flagellar hook-basal body complex protein FliE [Heliobacteriaceae bacterium]MDD4587066.1 flagellar hook-basal body complex protein FliE [Heliobacteriaceae bacterium]
MRVTKELLLPYPTRLHNQQTKPAGPEVPDFGTCLKDALQNVNNLSREADRQTMSLVSGQTEDIHQVMIAAEKASIAVQMTVQVRNKIMDAYNELMRMQM